MSTIIKDDEPNKLVTATISEMINDQDPFFLFEKIIYT